MRRSAAIVIPLLVVLALALWRAQGPAPKPAGAPEGEFSAERALTVLRALLAEGVPHPLGTPANARVRDRIVARFRALGYETSIQRRFACNARPHCAMVENVIARAPGASRNSVLLAAHYDSVPSGPGASDDGIGVAAQLEVARAMRGAKLRNPLIFLITDGEEAGLIGAEAFVADESLVRGVAVVVNIENRGTHGPSNMFETSSGNRWLVRHLARSLEHPQASSFSATVYDLLPNDTDVTVFKRAGMGALNFAAIFGPQRYHSPLDDLAHVSPRTLQHHGENALAVARALTDADLEARAAGDATFFDVLNFALIWWSSTVTPWLALASLALLMWGAARKTNARAMTFGVLATFTSMLLAVLGGIGVTWLARLRSDGMNWVAYPEPAIAAMWLTAIAAGLCGAALFRKRSDERALLFGAAIVWHAVAIALALTLPGISYLVLVPALAAALCAAAGASDTLTSSVASTAGAVVLFPLGLALHDALGGSMLPVIAVFLVVIATLAAPLFARFRNAAIFAVLALASAVVALLLPPATRAHPRHVVLAWLDDAAAQSPVWTTSVVTDSLRAAAPFTRASTALTPWRQTGSWTAPAPPTALARVTVRAERHGKTVVVHVASPRRADELSLVYRAFAPVSAIRINSVTPPPPPARFRRHDGEWRFLGANGVTEMTVELTTNGTLELIASDISYGLPTSGAPLIRARDASPAMPVHDGDVTITRARTGAGARGPADS